MSLVIKGMEMPKTCGDCPLSALRMDCKLTGRDISHDWMKRKIPDWCPLVPLPEGHGRLIDADALFEKMYRLSDNEGAHKNSRVDDALILRDSACYLIEDAPTIVPAEGD